MSIISFCETSSQVQTPRRRHNGKPRTPSSLSQTTTTGAGASASASAQPWLHSPDIRKFFKKNLNVPSAVNDIDSSIADMEEDSLSPPFLDFDDASQPYSSELATANFWDGLSKVWLTTRALEEFNRRTFHVQMPDPVNENLNEIVPVESIDLKALKRYARQGGPDLRDLRRYPYNPNNWHPSGDGMLKDPLHGRQQIRPNRQRKRQREEEKKSEPYPENNGDNTFAVEIGEAASMSQDNFEVVSPTASEVEQRRADEFDANFEQLLIDHGAYPPDYDYTLEGYPEPRYPMNWEEIVSRAKRRRPSVDRATTLGADEMDSLDIGNRMAWTEKDAETYVLPIITGEGKDSITASWSEEVEEETKHVNFQNQRKNELFENIEPAFGDHLSLPLARPSLYDGALPESLDPDLLHTLDRYISPSRDCLAPVLPNFFTECKGRLSDFLVAERQALYDGILGARAMRTLQSTWSKDDLVFDDNAYTIVSIFRAGELELYTVHPTIDNQAARTEYQMSLIGRWYLLESAEVFREAVCAIRNLRDWAREVREGFVERANWEAFYARHGMDEGVDLWLGEVSIE